MMVEDFKGKRWSIIQVIEARSLDFHRARALTHILHPDGVIRDAITYLEAMLANNLLIINACAASAAPADPDIAEEMDAASVLLDFGMTDGYLNCAIESILCDPAEIISSIDMRNDIRDAIKHLNDYLDSQDDDHG